MFGVKKAYRELNKLVRGLQQENNQLKAENSSLHMLVEDMLNCIEIQIAFDRTPKNWMYEEFVHRAQMWGIER